MPRSKRDKTTGLPLPSPVVPVSTICITIPVPNALEYRSALKGALSELGKPWTWSQTVGEDNQDAFTAAELWRAALADAEYQLDCGESMSCADLANCIETNEAVQDALSDQITNNTTNQTTIYNTSRIGPPLPPSQSSAPLVEIEGCDEDAVFGSITAIVDQLDRNNRDFLEIVEVGTNTRERVSSAIAAIPVLETLPIDDAIAFVDKLQSEILENYEAQWTDALRDTYRCELFCLALEQPECEITFDMLWDYWQNRVGVSLEPLNFLEALLQYFILGTWSGSQVVDILTTVQLGVWKTASNWTGITLRNLQTVGLLGANDGDHDWAVLPCECGDPSDPIEVLGTTDWTVAYSTEGFNVVNGVSYTIAATGLTAGYGGTGSYGPNGIPGTAGTFIFPCIANAGQLCGYIVDSPDGDWFAIGANHTFTADRTGVLHFAIADGPGGYGNNSGSLMVTVS